MIYSTHAAWASAARDHFAHAAFGINTAQASAITRHMHAHNGVIIALQANFDAAIALARPWVDRSPMLPFEAPPAEVTIAIRDAAKALRLAENAARKIAKGK